MIMIIPRFLIVEKFSTVLISGKEKEPHMAAPVFGGWSSFFGKTKKAIKRYFLLLRYGSGSSPK